VAEQGQGLLLLLLEHHCGLQDMQTVALLLCVFNKAIEGIEEREAKGLRPPPSTRDRFLFFFTLHPQFVFRPPTILSHATPDP
jgi:hypothetical protein